MKLILSFILLFSLSTACSKNISQNYSSDDISVAVIALDDGGIRPQNDDIRVNRAKYLLAEISKKTTESPKDIAANVNAFSSVLRENYGRDIKRLELLEEVKKALDQGSYKTVNDVLPLVSAKYAK